jgi:hypothetical protein
VRQDRERRDSERLERERQEKERQERVRQERERRNSEMETKGLAKIERAERRSFLSQLVEATKENSKGTLATYNKIIQSEERSTKSIIPACPNLSFVPSNLNHN